MKCRYDAREDRILLVLTPPGGERKVWVTRRLWLALYREIAAIAPSTPAEDAEAAARARPAAKAAAIDDGDATALLATVQIRRMAEGAALVFQGEEGPITLNLPTAGVAQFRRMLETQADRAGWDVPAAMERLGAEAMAGAAVRRAST